LTCIPKATAVPQHLQATLAPHPPPSTVSTAMHGDAHGDLAPFQRRGHLGGADGGMAKL
jgi:hypothetical protein